MPAPNPATGTAPAGPTPVIHPMDPSCGEHLSPRFAAILCFLIGRPAMTEPAITGVVASGDAVFAATAESRFHDTPIGPWHDVEGNLRAWGAVAGAPAEIVDGLVAKLRRASR